MKTFTYISLFLIFLLFFSSCSSENKAPEVLNNTLKYNLINPNYIDKLINPPLNYGSIWYASYLKKLTINNVNVVLRGGKNPNDVYEKQGYKFNKFGNLKESEFYLYTISNNKLNHFKYVYSDAQKLEKVSILKFFETSNEPPIFVFSDVTKEVFIKPKANKKNDSLIFIPSFDKPEIIIEKIGNVINHMEIFVEKGSPASVFMNKIYSIDSTLVSFELADKIVTYTDKNLPLESFHLGSNWKVMELAKKWEYNRFNQPIEFTEWLHGTQIKNISIKYNENALPKKYIFNKKSYTLIYKKI